MPFTDIAAHVEPSGPAVTTPVELVDPVGCGRFTATVLTGVEVKPSARWMAERLHRAGMRPINNVVDVSNYVMLELGQPNHPYDLDRLPGGAFRVRRAAAGETMTTLDDVARTFTTDDLLICDGEDTPIGIAGIMGGASSEIHDGTTTVALEMAWFEPGGVARTAARLGLRSEASARFERGVDPYVIDAAIGRFVELLRETSPSVQVAPGAVDARGVLPEPAAPRLRTSRANELLGIELTDDDIARLLEPIGFDVTPTESPGVQQVAIPSWRPDCVEEIDVIEEVARQYGYERIGKTVPTSAHPGSLTRAPARPPAAPPGDGGPRAGRSHAPAAARARRPCQGRAGRGRHRPHQPDGRRGGPAAHVAAAGPAAVPGLQRVAPQRRRRPVRAGPRVPPCARRRAAARRARDAHRRARRCRRHGCRGVVA